MSVGPLIALAAGASVVQGVMGYQAARDEARLINQQGILEQQEAQEEAQRKANEVRKFAARQKLAFLKNGVRLEGSPLLVVDETLTEGQKEVDAITRRGNALRTLRAQEAQITKNRGRAALIGGLGQAAGLGYSYYNKSPLSTTG